MGHQKLKQINQDIDSNLGHNQSLYNNNLTQHSKFAKNNLAKSGISLIHFKAVNKNWTPADEKTCQWLNRHFERSLNNNNNNNNNNYNFRAMNNRNLQYEPNLKELMNSSTAYNYLESSKDFSTIDQNRMFAMNQSILKYQNIDYDFDFNDGDRSTSDRNISPNNTHSVRHDLQSPTKNSKSVTFSQNNPSQKQKQQQQLLTSSLQSSSSPPIISFDHHQNHQNQLNASQYTAANYRSQAMTVDRSLFTRSNANTEFRYREDSDMKDNETSRF